MNDLAAQAEPQQTNEVRQAKQSAGATKGLILSGGGARAAYQVGVLKAITDLLPNPHVNPFPVIIGTSAGAINAVSLACGATYFSQAVQRLQDVWQGFSSDQVYRTDWPGVLNQARRFVWQHLLGLGRGAPVALLDNSPLQSLLQSKLNFADIEQAFVQRALSAIGITAFSYHSAQATTFFQSNKESVDAWHRYRRLGHETTLKLEHLLASTAIPLMFPPVKIEHEYYGDGAVRQAAPISPALHLGANKILVVGVNSQHIYEEPPKYQQPTLAQIAAHLLSSTFTDNLEKDLELLQRLNRLGTLLPQELRTKETGLAPVEVLVISPSRVIDEIAARHRKQLPASMRLFLRGSGATRRTGGGVLSYLLFEKDYCRELIELGFQDAMKRKNELQDFLELS